MKKRDVLMRSYSVVRAFQKMRGSEKTGARAGRRTCGKARARAAPETAAGESARDVLAVLWVSGESATMARGAHRAGGATSSGSATRACRLPRPRCSWRSACLDCQKSDG